MARLVLLTVEIATSDGTLRGQVPMSPDPVPLAAMVPAMLQLCEAITGRAQHRERAAGRAISCCAGCGACCRQMVPLSAPEAFFLADLLDGMPADVRARALERFSTIDARLDQLGLVETLLYPATSDDDMMRLSRTYFSLQMPCPFLVDESCSIYQHRPTVCREYTVTTPAAWCADPYSNPIRRVPAARPLSAPLAQLVAVLTGQPPHLIPLGLVPRYVAANEELRQRRWPGVELFQKLLSLLAPPAAPPAQ